MKNSILINYAIPVPASCCGGENALLTSLYFAHHSGVNRSYIGQQRTPDRTFYQRDSLRLEKVILAAYISDKNYAAVKIFGYQIFFK